MRRDLGIGGMSMNFIVSPGQDTVLVDRGLKNFISGMAHVYLYDYDYGYDRLLGYRKISTRGMF